MTPTLERTVGAGRFFEHFKIGETIRHATPRTIREGDAALYAALYGSRFPVQSAETFAKAIGYRASPIDDLLVFNVVFGKSVPDVSLNAVANLGYAECRFMKPVYPGDTLTAVSEVIGLRETSNRESGVVTVRTRGVNQSGDDVLRFVRWVLVRKRDPAANAAPPFIPKLADAVPVSGLGEGCPSIDLATYDCSLSGSDRAFEDYAPGERIDHFDGATVEEAEHMIATRLYQNTAKVHFNQLSGRRLIYGGHVISLARALSFNGLQNAFHIAAINGGRHVAPLFAGDTVHAWSLIRETAALPGRDDVGALRIQTIATKDRPCGDFPLHAGDGYEASVVLDLDYWALAPRRQSPSLGAAFAASVSAATR